MDRRFGFLFIAKKAIDINDLERDERSCWFSSRGLTEATDDVTDVISDGGY